MAILGGVIGIGATPARAAIISASDVAAAVSAPASSTSAFSVTGTLTNTGLLTQQGNSTLTIAAANGSLSGLPASCSPGTFSTTCSAANLPSGGSQTFTVTVTPAAGATSVSTTATAASALPEINILPDSANNTASAVTGVAYNLSSSLISTPSTVRNGDDTLLTASATNGGAPQNITVNIATGNVYDPQLPLPAGCAPGSFSNTNVLCTAFYATGQTRSFDVAVVSPATGNTLVSSLTATGAIGGSSSASTNTGLFGEATAFVPPGDCLNDSAAGTYSYTSNICLPSSSNGSTMDLNFVTFSGMCGSNPCAPRAAEAIFPNTGYYSSNDVANPYIWKISYGKLQCNGIGNPNCSNVLHVQPSAGPQAGQIYAIPNCSTFGQAQATLSNVYEICLQDKAKEGNNWTFTIALLKDIVIPIIGGISSGAK